MTRSFNVVLAVLGALLADATCRPAADPDPAKPNIIFIMADDLGYGDLSSCGATKFETPNIDTLALEGMRFTDAHSPHSVCTPTRYAVLTGRYAWRGRLKSKVLWSGYEPLLVEKGRKTVGHMMKEIGYHTAQIGKWHLGWGDDGGKTDFTAGVLPRGPRELGFDYSFVTASCKNMYPFVLVENRKAVSTMHLDPKPPTEFDKRHCHGPRLVADDWNTALVDQTYTDKAIVFLRQHKAKSPDRPFYVHLTYEAPHKPHDVPARFVGASGVSQHCDQILYLDEQVGRVLKAVDELGYKQSTLILFTSDNGAEPDGEGRKNGHRTNGELRGQKRSILEGGHRVPLLARWPGVIKAGMTSDSLVCLSDMMATYAAITGYKLTDGMGEDSFNAWPAFLGSDEVIRESIIHQDISGTLGIRHKKWKFVPAARKTKLDPGDKFAVFDMENDWRETTNLIETHPELAEQLKALLREQKADGRTVTHSK
jgi:arylsulfatase A-like enzyme